MIIHEITLFDFNFGRYNSDLSEKKFLHYLEEQINNLSAFTSVGNELLGKVVVRSCSNEVKPPCRAKKLPCGIPAGARVS